MDIYTSNELTI